MKRRTIIVTIVFLLLATAAAAPTIYFFASQKSDAQLQERAVAPKRDNDWVLQQALPDCAALGTPGHIERHGAIVDCAVPRVRHQAAATPKPVVRRKPHSGASNRTLAGAVIDKIADVGAPLEEVPEKLVLPTGDAQEPETRASADDKFAVLAPSFSPGALALGSGNFLPGGGVGGGGGAPIGGEGDGDPAPLASSSEPPASSPVDGGPQKTVLGPPGGDGGSTTSSDTPKDPFDLSDGFLSDDIPDDLEVLETPLPPGFILMLTAVAGLYRAARNTARP